MDNNSKFWNLFSVILGIGMIILSLKDFILSFVLFVLGLMLTNYGLKRMNKPPLIEIVKGWISEFD